jgi:hypothetical protein
MFSEILGMKNRLFKFIKFTLIFSLGLFFGEYIFNLIFGLEGGLGIIELQKAIFIGTFVAVFLSIQKQPNK